MTSELDIGQLLQAASAALKEQSVGKEFMLNDVLRETRAAYERFPEDPVIRQVAFTIERMADRAPAGATISQADLSSIHNDLVRLSSESKFRSVLGHLLLGEQEIKTSHNEKFVNMNRVDAETSGISNEDLADQSLVGALSDAFGGSMNEAKAFDKSKAKMGADFVKMELEAMGYKKPDVEVMGGDKNTLVYAAHVDTRNGIVSVAIPIKLAENGGLLLPSTFVADNQLQELTPQKFQYFVDKKGERRDFSIPKTSDVLRAVGILTGQKTVEAKDFSDLAALFGDGEQVSLNVPSLYVDKEYEEPQSYIDTKPDAQMPKELAHLAKDFEDNVLEAVSSFGREAVDSGKRMVLSELGASGLKHAQVRYGSESGDSVIYLATIATPRGPLDIEVPVEMVAKADDKYVPLLPKCFAYDGVINDFLPSNLQKFAINPPQPSTSSRVYKDAFEYMTLPELREQMVSAISDDDYVSAEAVLEHIGDRFSEEDHKNTIADYNNVMLHKSAISKQACVTHHTCCKVIPAGKGSIYARCGHFGVPLNQVVADAQGNCRLKSAAVRDTLNPIDESGANISTSKLLLT